MDRAVGPAFPLQEACCTSSPIAPMFDTFALVQRNLETRGGEVDYRQLSESQFVSRSVVRSKSCTTSGKEVLKGAFCRRPRKLELAPHAWGVQALRAPLVV